MDCNLSGSSVHGDSPGKNIEVGCHNLLQGVFLTQGSNPDLHCRWILHRLRHERSPRILEWVAYSFSRGSSRPRNWTRVSCIADGFFTIRATRDAHGQVMNPPCRVNWKTTTPAHCLRPAMTPVPWQILYWIWSLCQEAVEAWTFQSIWAIKTPTRQTCAYHHVVSYV